MSRSFLAAATLGLAIAVAPMAGTAEAKPGGCLKYGAAGAVAGHVAGGYKLKGALVGCAVGWWQRRKYNRQMRMQQRQQAYPRANTRSM